MTECPLCLHENLTHQYAEDDRFYICDCLTCGKDHPIIVSKIHTMVLSAGDIVHMVNMISSSFGNYWRLRFEQKRIFGHFHAHIAYFEENK